ncbi:polysaccharide pyruvyl transferase family protein [Polaribacter undariae]|uniref:Polysaccharide pyruvyl transferase family protein n=1 Tax=Polaribacter sejongensis TaxID=985043 RepID=A0AAJ1VGC9_9FLAO|nr:polysaccharide pyruvyl transferase family protein [Polaribacter undariae]MDN3619149.1 polysaccharide pyruvyl transferase family protein [Polaribacter undariae]UWD33650.1 polysaccharide pyruvyl transferase family protein [Polaribacter undariae]
MKYKNIAVLTFQSSNNYGALLQCYALSTTLEELGFNVQIFNLKKEHIKDIEDLPFLSRNKRVFKKSINNAIFESAFDNFRKKYLKSKFTKEIGTKDGLKEFSDSFDAVVVGSDQVWRGAYTKKLQSSFFFDFISDKTKKISYAASFGLDYFEGFKNNESEINTLINKFNAISVREAEGVKICKETFNVEAIHVLDPVFLLSKERYQKIIDAEFKKNENSYVAYYFLNPDAYRKTILTSVKKEFKIKDEINIYTNNKFSFRRPSFNLSKYKFKTFSTWLGELSNADFVVTDSFHGLAFSIIFNKQFVCIANSKRGASRMKSLLSLFNLSHRLVNEGESINFETLKTIDYTVVNREIDNQKLKSINFLQKSIS